MTVRIGATFASLCALAVSSCSSQPEKPLTDVEQGFAGALRGCEEWLLNPSSWVKTDAPFLASTGLGDKIAHVEQVDESALPPASMRDANRYYVVRATADATFTLVVSYQIPMCHISGRADDDLQPVVNAVLASTAFGDSWSKTGEEKRGTIVSTQFSSRKDKALNLLVTRSQQPGDPVDRVQIMASATKGIPL